MGEHCQFGLTIFEIINGPNSHAAAYLQLCLLCRLASCSVLEAFTFCLNLAQLRVLGLCQSQQVIAGDQGPYQPDYTSQLPAWPPSSQHTCMQLLLRTRQWRMATSKACCTPPSGPRRHQTGSSAAGSSSPRGCLPSALPSTITVSRTALTSVSNSEHL